MAAVSALVLVCGGAKEALDCPLGGTDAPDNVGGLGLPAADADGPEADGALSVAALLLLGAGAMSAAGTLKVPLVRESARGGLVV